MCFRDVQTNERETKEGEMKRGKPQNDIESRSCSECCGVTRPVAVASADGGPWASSALRSTVMRSNDHTIIDS